MPDFSFSYEELNSSQGLAKEKLELVQCSMELCKNAYAPYSHFQVGCAVLLDSGEIIKGANVENASYPVGICAERTALAHAVSNFPKAQIISLAISYQSEKELEEIIFPCGMCRQFILECQTRNKQAIELLLNSPNGKCIRIKDASHLLPFGFTGDHLK